MEIRPLGPADARAWWDLRLEALETEPFAFSKAVEEHRATPVEAIAARLHENPENFTIGAFEGGKLIGNATFMRAGGEKERHKGHVLAVYVTATRRRTGVGEALMEALLAKAKRDPSLEQFLLVVSIRHEAAERLYRRFGFETYGTEPRALKVEAEYVDTACMVLQVR